MLDVVTLAYPLAVLAHRATLARVLILADELAPDARALNARTDSANLNEHPIMGRFSGRFPLGQSRW